MFCGGETTALRIILLLLMLLPTPSYAGLRTNVALAGISYTASRVIIPAVISGRGKELAAGALVKVANNPKAVMYVVGILSVYIITMPDTDYERNAKDILEWSGLYGDPDFEIYFRELQDNYMSHMTTLEATAKEVENDPSARCQFRDDIYQRNPALNVQSVHNPVREWDYGSYRSLESHSVSGDNLEHDHIPSKASVKEYLKRRDGDVLWAKNLAGIVERNATAVEVTRESHKHGRTYGGRNIAAMVVSDSRNLRLATMKDLAYYFLHNPVLPRSAILNFKDIYVRNKLLCLYE